MLKGQFNPILYLKNKEKSTLWVQLQTQNKDTELTVIYGAFFFLHRFATTTKRQKKMLSMSLQSASTHFYIRHRQRHENCQSRRDMLFQVFHSPMLSWGWRWSASRGLHQTLSIESFFFFFYKISAFHDVRFGWNDPLKNKETRLGLKAPVPNTRPI